MQVVPVVVVSDFASPFCWIAEAELRRLKEEGRITLQYHAYELFPVPGPVDAPQDVEAALPLARELGLHLRAPTQLPRTRKAHELVRLARVQGLEDALREAIFQAYFRDDRDIGRIDVLVGLARDVGLDVTEAKVVLDVDKYAAAVAAEGEQARAAGIGGVPVLLLGEGQSRMRLDGAFPPAELRALIDQIERETGSGSR